ncbi:MAG: alanine--tRNA ligase [Calditrichaeota bacterium]|nr:MAG: alanine--tRNA ligase [Calditrichota bacterium]MBL1206823.1 alanine--tRNA ligase [Calditrichota bacterium]NOG46650.1 alanine--tRNA ligase [Calditrichota bacterium]
MTSNEIRKQFIDFFKDKQHTFVQSASVVPLDDPTLLFTNAGMNQFKDVFLAKGERDFKRAANSQKCIRVSGKHNDLEEVGHDTYHHTFFEMLGNWSFGDYYKKEAIAWAWELLTEVWKLPKERLYATVFGGDKGDGLEADYEAENLWKEMTDIDPSHILQCSKEDNFWEMGATGPCGPCSEIHIDLTPDLSGGKLVNAGVPEVIEIWNLVFIQYNRDESGTLTSLPAKHVDTGAGFERIVAVMQNKNSNYDTDVFMPILNEIGKLVGESYITSKEQIAFRVIADHIRMLTFSIADGGLPSNEGRGYVMRRILRRAARYGRNLNLHEPFLYKLVPGLVKHMGDAYPELKERKDHVIKVIRAEEEHFNRTLDRGLEIFAKIVKQLSQNNENIIPGTEVFKLYDTFGFPVDLTRLMADENNLAIDMAGFEKEMNNQRKRARAAAKFTSQTVSTDEWVVMNDGDDSEFVGYEETTINSHISRYHKDGKTINLRLLKTPFYAESGGQVGDKGTLEGDGFTLDILDTQKEGNAIIHICESKGEFNPTSDKVYAQINDSERRRTIKNHTATHLLQAALQQVLGDHVHQSGSLVEPDRLRFDFTHFEKVTPQEIGKIEQIVNEQIQKDTHLEIAWKNIEEAKAEGAMALFGEKYGDIVRTVKVGDYSLELCGGTHVNGTGEIGPFIITTEEGIAAGVRRIEAITGPKAVQYFQSTRSRVSEIGQLLNSPESEINVKVQSLLDDKKNLEKELAQTKSDQLSGDLNGIINSAKEINSVKVLIHKVDNVDMKSLKDLGDKLREKVKNTIGLIASVNGDKLAFVALVSDDLLKKYKAGDLVREVAITAGGGGGGKPHMASAGGKDVSKLDEALKRFEELA